MAVVRLGRPNSTSVATFDHPPGSTRRPDAGATRCPARETRGVTVGWLRSRSGNSDREPERQLHQRLATTQSSRRPARVGPDRRSASRSASSRLQQRHVRRLETSLRPADTRRLAQAVTRAAIPPPSSRSRGWRRDGAGPVPAPARPHRCAGSLDPELPLALRCAPARAPGLRVGRRRSTSTFATNSADRSRRSAHDLVVEAHESRAYRPFPQVAERPGGAGDRPPPEAGAGHQHDRQRARGRPVLP